MTNWPTKKVSECIDKFPKNFGIPRNKYQKNGKFPVVDQGQDFIGGYTNDELVVYKDNLPVVVFGDHTRAVKFIDFPFAVGADGTQVLKPKDFLNPKYFYLALLNLDIQPRGYARHFKLLKEKEIPLPAIEEQKRIVKKLENLLGKVKEAKRLRAEAQAATANLLPAELHKIFSECKSRNEPEELGTVATLVRGPFGGSLKKETFTDTGECVYEQGNVIDNDLVRFRYFISPKKFQEMARFAVSAGDVLMSCSGTIGKLVVVPSKFQKGIINQALLKISPNGKVTSDFLRYALQDYLSLSTSHVKGMAIKNIAAVKELKKFKIPIPPLAEQEMIVARLDSLSEKIRQLQDYQKQTAADLDALEKSILHQAFAGKL